ncbi:MAG: helix-turn-helix domain-containing protein [Henriciella sp.]|nr:helix-turn-helix domain-containing protein [Henriciella sp.]
MSDTKTRILDAASNLFAEDGASALSVRAISKRAGLSTIGIYNHFQGKQGILDALYVEGFNMIAAAMRASHDAASPRQGIIDAITRYMTISTEQAGHFRLIFGQGDSSYTPSDAAKTVGAAAFDDFVYLVARALPKDCPRNKLREVALQIFATAHGYATLQHHETTELMRAPDWTALAINAITALLDAAMATDRPPHSGHKNR